MWAGLRTSARVARCEASAQQKLAIGRLQGAAAYVVDGLDGVKNGSIPRTPTEGWEQLLKDARISYHGEVVTKAEMLELDRVLASLRLWWCRGHS